MSLRSIFSLMFLGTFILSLVIGCSPAPECKDGDRRECMTGGGKVGDQRCGIVDGIGKWGNCIERPECKEGDVSSCLQGDGTQGRKICESGKWGICAPIPCTNGQFRPCTLPTGKQGTQQCLEGKWDICVEPPCDEGSVKQCITATGKNGIQKCIDGKWQICAEPPCDEGITKDCKMPDGSEGIQRCIGGKWAECSTSCTDGTARTCFLPDGKRGRQICSNNKWSDCQLLKCQDGEKQSCQTACGTGTEICIKEEWQNCDAPKPQPEICDGIDNNCDGQIDEGCDCIHGRCRPCYSGATGCTKNADGSFTCLGICRAGKQCCDKGVWGDCLDQVMPAAKEICTDQRDHDCDGDAYNGCDCKPGETKACGSKVGECKEGTVTCNQNASWGPCVGEIPPQAEKGFGCDGKDNDCNGIIDDGLESDKDESNNNCSQSRQHTVDGNEPAVVIDRTIYPEGDVDYFQINAKEGSSWCVPTRAQCNFFTAELYQPNVSGVQYRFTLMTKNCSSPEQTFKGSGDKISLIWEGVCGLNDDQTFWIKVEPDASSSPKFTCKPYQLNMKLVVQQAHCCTFTPCKTDADCKADGCGACKSGKCEAP